MKGFAALLLAACIAAPAAGAVLYKWTDAQGKVQYSDRPPKGFKGEVTRIESDPAPVPGVPAQAAPAQAAQPAEPAAAAAPVDIGARRRATRERLRAEVDRAEARLAAARKALADASEQSPENHQVIQQRVTNVATARARANCRPSATKDTVICPTMIPKPEHLESLERLEEEVRRAEEALADAQRAYRRGVD